MSTQLYSGSHQRPTMIQDFCSHAQSRFSAFFHGHSVLTKERYSPPSVSTKAAQPFSSHSAILGDIPRRPGPVSRSRTSTRSLIDPISSPLSSPRTPQIEEPWLYNGVLFRPVATQASTPRLSTQTDQQPPIRSAVHYDRPSLSRKAKEKRRCFPAVKDHRIKQKIIGSLISGTLLVLLLTICKSFSVS